MKARSSERHAVGTVVVVLAAILGASVSVAWSASDGAASEKAQLAPKAKLDVVRDLVRAGAMPSSHLPKSLMAPCKDVAVHQSSVTYSQFAEVEITLSATVSLKRLSAYPLAPGSQIEMLDNGARVRAQLPAPIVGSLIEEGADVKVLRDFMLWEQPVSTSNVAKDRLTAATATCSGTYVQGTNSTHYNIPEGDWVYSDIQLASAPSNSQVTCVDVHYEVVHPFAGDVVVDLTDEDMTYTYHLHLSSKTDDSQNISQTVTGITIFSGSDSSYPYGHEGVNQKWTLWAFDEYTGQTGYISTWWIKVYYTVPATSPSNDACANAVALTDNTPYQGTTIGATGTYQSQCGLFDSLDTWHTFTPTQTGLVTISAGTRNTNPFDTTLSVFDGCGGTELACNDDDCASKPDSKITMQMFKNTTYYIRVAGYDYRTGDYTLTVVQQAKQTPATPATPSPASGDTSIETQLVLSWNDSAGLVDSLNIAKSKEEPKPGVDEQYSPKVIYGKDDRQEDYQVTSSAYHHAGDATIMLMYWTDLTDNGDGTYTLPPKTFAQWYTTLNPIDSNLPLCSTEPYQNEIAPGICSGVLVAPDIIATAGHCAACEAITNLAVVFGFVMKSSSTAVTTLASTDVYRCSEVIAYHDSYPDWALIRLDRPVTTHVPANLRLSGKVADAQPLVAIGHPWGIPRKYDAGGKVEDNTPQTYFQANVDTYIGSSGSPIFSQKDLLVEGVVSTGKQDFITDVARSCDESYVCADTGCPDWENITRARTFSGIVPSYDVYFGTDQGNLPLVASYSPVPWFNPGPLNTSTTYYWKITARNAWTEVAGPVWSFTTASSTVYRPVYRFWSPKTGKHFYTIKESEKTKLITLYSATWTYEGIVFYAFETSQPGSAPIYRFWSDKAASHVFTMSESEKTKLITQYSASWTYEGIVFYAYPAGATDPQPAGTRAVYRFYAPKTGEHFFTIKESEKDKLVNAPSTWTLEGTGWYAFE